MLGDLNGPFQLLTRGLNTFVLPGFGPMHVPTGAGGAWAR